jgi:hypothetical protein
MVSANGVVATAEAISDAPADKRVLLMNISF